MRTVRPASKALYDRLFFDLRHRDELAVKLEKKSVVKEGEEYQLRPKDWLQREGIFSYVFLFLCW